jgi:hypothetical protein
MGYGVNQRDTNARFKQRRDGYPRILQVAAIAMSRGINPASRQMIDVVRAAVPGIGQDEIKAALRWWTELA